MKTEKVNHHQPAHPIHPATDLLASFAYACCCLPRWSHPAAHRTFPFPFATSDFYRAKKEPISPLAQTPKTPSFKLLPSASSLSRVMATADHSHHFSSFLTIPCSAASSMFIFQPHTRLPVWVTDTVQHNALFDRRDAPPVRKPKSEHLLNSRHQVDWLRRISSHAVDVRNDRNLQFKRFSLLSFRIDGCSLTTLFSNVLHTTGDVARQSLKCVYVNLRQMGVCVV